MTVGLCNGFPPEDTWSMPVSPPHGELPRTQGAALLNVQEGAALLNGCSSLSPRKSASALQLLQRRRLFIAPPKPMPIVEVPPEDAECPPWKFDEAPGCGLGIGLNEDGPQEFHATIVKCADSNALALDVDAVDGLTLLVKRVKSGPILRWNKGACDSGKDIRMYDRIVEVNGIRGDAADLLRAIKDDRRVELLIRRPTVFRLGVTKSSPTDELGAGIDSGDGRTLLVVCVKERGLLGEWNKEHWEVPVRKNDRIVEVNGVRGCSARLLEAIRNAGRLDMVLEH